MPKTTCSVSIIIPARNERGTIEAAVRRLPMMGRSTELIFVEGGSTDGTRAEIERVKAAYPHLAISLLTQLTASGKGEAVRQGFAAARGELLIILDADLSVAPEDLPRFYAALRSGPGQLINGTRFRYSPEPQAMRPLNQLGNKLFTRFLSWIIGQSLTDTLCGTKALWRVDYDKILAHPIVPNDPYGDFTLLFGAAYCGFTIVEVPVPYYARVYGQTNIKRWRDGWRLFHLALAAAWKLKTSNQ